MDSNDKEKVKLTPMKFSKHFLLIYCICLLLFVGIIILLSYMAQAKFAHENDQIRKELSDKAVVAAGAMTRLDQIMDKNTELESALKTEQDKNTKLTADLNTANTENTTQTNQISDQQAQIDQLTKQNTANEYLWQLEKLYSQRKYSSCRSLIKKIKAQQLDSAFSEQGATEYERIKTKVKG